MTLIKKRRKRLSGTKNTVLQPSLLLQRRFAEGEERAQLSATSRYLQTMMHLSQA